MTGLRHLGGSLVVLVLLVAPELQGATIQGRVVHPERSDAAAGLEVVAVGLGRDGETIERAARADREGGFRLEELPAPAAYLLRTRYGGIPFPGGSVVFQKDDPGESRQVTLHIYDHTSDISEAVLRRIRLVVEREAATYRISHDILITNPGNAVILRQDSEAPVFRVGLPVGHGELDRPSGSPAAGQRVVDDTLEIRGPIYPGEQEIRLVYDVSSADTDLDTRIPFPDPVEIVELYVKDFGIEVDAGPLHAARATRNGDVIYQSYVGFDLPGDSALPVRVAALPPHGSSPPWARGLLLILVGIGSAVFVARPVVEAPTDDGAAKIDDEPEKQALFAALEDLEHDFETGKLSTEDRDQLRRDLKREALQAMARTRRPEPAVGENEALRLCRCGNRPRPGDRFCSACGDPL
jgi:hypothetical protein